MSKKRLDIIVSERNLLASRQIAQSYIIQGLVKVNGIVRTKPGLNIQESDRIEIAEPSRKYVSRGGIKLEHALQQFDIDVTGFTVLDAGASTGGFTDCLLKYGASKVYAVDVGKGQLDYNLRNNAKVITIENCNVRYMDEHTVSEKTDLITMDLSFISIEKVLGNLAKFLKAKGKIIALIKPQFEAGKGKTDKGVIKDPAVHIQVLRAFADFCNQSEQYLHQLTYSPIKGPSGNIEFFGLLSNDPPDETLPDIPSFVENTWNYFESQKK